VHPELIFTDFNNHRITYFQAITGRGKHQIFIRFGAYHNLMLSWDTGIKVSKITEFPAYLVDLSSHLLQSLFNIKFVKLSLYDEIKIK